MGEKRPRLCRQNGRCKTEMPSQVGNRKGWTREEDREERYSSKDTSETQMRREEPGGERSRGRRPGAVLRSSDRVRLLRNDGKTQWAHRSCKGAGEGSEGARGSLEAKIN